MTDYSWSVPQIPMCRSAPSPRRWMRDAEEGEAAWHKESGSSNWSCWIRGRGRAHIPQDTRTFYNLEKLWAMPKSAGDRRSRTQTPARTTPRSPRAKAKTPKPTRTKPGHESVLREKSPRPLPTGITPAFPCHSRSPVRRARRPDDEHRDAPRETDRRKSRELAAEIVARLDPDPSLVAAVESRGRLHQFFVYGNTISASSKSSCGPGFLRRSALGKGGRCRSSS